MPDGSQFPPAFEGHQVVEARIHLTGAGGALAPHRVIEVEDEVVLIVKGRCSKVAFASTDDGIKRIQTVAATKVMEVTADRAEDLLDELDQEASARRGQPRLPGMEAGAQAGSTVTVDADGTLLTTAEVADRRGAPPQEHPTLLVAFAPAPGEEEAELVMWPDAWPDVAPPLVLSGDGRLEHPSGVERHVVAVLATNGELRVPQWDEPDDALMEEATAWFEEVRQAPAWGNAERLVEQVAEMPETSARYVAVIQQDGEEPPDEAVMLAVHRRLAVLADVRFVEPGDAAAAVVDADEEPELEPATGEGPADLLEDGLKIDEVRSRAAVVPIDRVWKALGEEEAKKRPRARVLKALREALSARAVELDGLRAAEALAESTGQAAAERAADDDLFGDPPLPELPEEVA